jgi:hypothetical protein
MVRQKLFVDFRKLKISLFPGWNQGSVIVFKEPALPRSPQE